MELCFNTDGWFYMLMYDDDEDDDFFDVYEGTYTTENDKIILSLLWEINYCDGEYEKLFIDYEDDMDGIFKVDGDKLFITADDERLKFTRSNPSGLWEFGREIPGRFDNSPYWRANNPIIGTWVLQGDGIFGGKELYFNINGEFYWIEYCDVDFGDFDVHEGIYIASESILTIVEQRGYEFYDGEFQRLHYIDGCSSCEYEEKFLFDDKALTLTIDGEVFVRGEPSGRWYFGKQPPVN